MDSAVTIAELNEEDRNRRVVKRYIESTIPGFYDKRCRKGHSYEKIENKYGNEVCVKWICKHCQMELK